jgi:hypothetical protein
VLELEMFQAKVAEKIKTHFMFNKSIFKKSCHLRGNVEKYCSAGQAIQDNTAHAHCMQDT